MDFSSQSRRSQTARIAISCHPLFPQAWNANAEYCSPYIRNSMAPGVNIRKTHDSNSDRRSIEPWQPNRTYPMNITSDVAGDVYPAHGSATIWLIRSLAIRLLMNCSVLCTSSEYSVPWDHIPCIGILPHSRTYGHTIVTQASFAFSFCMGHSFSCNPFKSTRIAVLTDGFWGLHCITFHFSYTIHSQPYLMQKICCALQSCLYLQESRVRFSIASCEAWR